MKKIILGNVITIDDSNPKAEAIVVNDGKIEYVGDKSEAIKLAGEDAAVLDYSNSYIYPGFIEPHCHGLFAGYRAIGQANLTKAAPADYKKYAEIIKEFIEKHPNDDHYFAAGWIEDTTPIDYKYLDEICPDKPLIMNTAGGHSCLVNTKAMEKYGINKDLVKKFGEARVRVDKNGNPTGYICEEPCVKLLRDASPTLEEAKAYLLNWQETALSNGFTAVADAGAELIYKDSPIAYSELQNEGKLKLRTYAFSLVGDNVEDPKSKIKDIVELKNKYDGEYFKIIGAKVFLDGVAEARTSWSVEEYEDEKGYYGVKRFSDVDKMVELVTEASKNGLSVHSHSEGDGATKFMLECIKRSQEKTNDLDQRNIIAHLHFVKPEDIENMAKTRSIACVPPLWTPKFKITYASELKSFGEDRAFHGYPIKSFVDAGAKIVFHSDYPISTPMFPTRSIFMAVERAVPEKDHGGVEKTQRNKAEAIDRLESLRALSINPAYALKQEKTMGSIEKGKIANFVVYDLDFLNCDINDIPNAKLEKTIVDGEIVFEG